MTSWFSSLAILTIFCSLATGINTKPNFAGIPPDECTNTVCKQAHEQAKGLSQLALLDEFVSQTVFLLHELMNNIDGELEKSANSLLRYIHPYCEPTRQILNEVIQKQKEKLTRGSKALSEGINPMTDDQDVEQTESRYNYDENSTDNYNRESTSERSWRWDYDDDSDDKFVGPGTISSSSTYGTGSTSGSRTEHSQGNRHQQTWSGQERNNQGWSGTNQKPYKSSEDDNQSSRSLGSSGQYETTKDRNSQFGERTTSSRGSGKSLDINGGSRKAKSDDKEGCRGIDRGSAFWTPGLDKWCRDNCSRGYCPKTHCQC